MKKFLETVKQNAPAYRSLPFWSWNDRLEEEELRKQIRDMKEIGMGGFFMHARGGLETEYLSDEWFNCIRACIDEAKKRGMEAWAYDENGWPSGFAGGKLLDREEFLMRGIVCAKETSFPVDEEDVIAVYVATDNRAHLVTEAQVGVTEYDVIRCIVTPTYVDTMRRDVTEAFIRETHERYKAEIAAEDFGKVMPGFFTDEPQYSRPHTPYSLTLRDEFQKAYGYDMLGNMAALFYEYDGYREFRYDYYCLCSRLFIENFMKPIYDWCTANGCQLTGHGIEEKTLLAQVQCCGSIMPVYEYEHIPGVDHLGRRYGDNVMGRQLGSVCAQLGKKKALSETFACCGWDVSPRELKNIAETQYVGGVNLMCQHLYPYSERGQRKRDYPAHYSRHLPWHDSMAAFDRYFTNLGCLLTRGTEAVRTLMIHPIHAAFSQYCQNDPQGSVGELDKKWLSLVAELSRHGHPYHFGEESILARHAKVEGNSLRVGECVYDRILIPDMDTLDANTVSLLQEYIAAGGKICFAGQKPSRINARVAEEELAFLEANMTLAELLDEAPVQYTVTGDTNTIRAMVRDTEAGKLIYLTNVSAEVYKDVKLTVAGARGLWEIDVATLTERPAYTEERDGKLTLTLNFDEAQSYVFITSKEPLAAEKPIAERESIRLENRFTLTEMPENALTLDKFSEARGDAPFSAPKPIEQIRDNLLTDKYEGTLALRATFTIDEMPSELRLAAELYACADMRVNGQPVNMETVAAFEKDLCSADILPYVHVGENEIIYRIHYYQRPFVHEALASTMETMRNCLAFDTEIECLYLFGKFIVKTEADRYTAEPHNAWRYSGDFRLGVQKKEIDLADIARDGYPFFAGSVTAETTLTYCAGDPTVLDIRGRYATCGVEINGIDMGTLLFEHRMDLCAYLQEGENVLRLTLTNSCRNLLGPHHYREAEPYSISPPTFSFEKQWKGDQCGAFNPAYAFVRFGLDF